MRIGLFSDSLCSPEEENTWDKVNRSMNGRLKRDGRDEAASEEEI